MCISVRYAPLDSLRPWDASLRTINIPRELAEPPFAARAVRAVLRQLSIPQPKTGARCWCGESILLPAHP
jgi:hypothetical protein